MSWSANTFDGPAMQSAPAVAVAVDHAPTGTHFSNVTPPASADELQSESERQPSITSSGDQSIERIAVPVPSACVQCRSKHLKCDGSNPCSRCSLNTLECTYVKSRRGYKGPRKNAQQGSAASITGSTPRACPLVNPNAARHTSKTGLATPPEGRLEMPLAPIALPPNEFGTGQDLVAFDSASLPSGLDTRERCIEAFYYHFWPAHPFLLPRADFKALRNNNPQKHLESAMRYVGSFYLKEASTTALGQEAEALVYDADCPQDGFRVQALLILTIALDGYTYQEKALQILIDAQNLALELGMNTREFAHTCGDGSRVMEESWRRTWWELFVVDGMIAGVHQKSSFRLNEIANDVGLPCEEKEYTSGAIPMPHYMHEFDDESFDDREVHYSSFTYRIAALRNLGRVLASRQFWQTDPAAIDRIDAFLVSWKLHLPDSKRVFITSDGYLDEMIFQAHMVAEASTILLHREHSELDSSIAKSVTSCAPHKAIVPGESYNTHAAKTIRAAQDISKLITLPVSLAKHTHFFTCVVTLASIVHLSVWSALIYDVDLKQQLRLNTGALKTLWQIWPSAGQAFGQVKGVAQEIWASKKKAAEVGYWVNFTNDEVMGSIVEDQSIMEELQLL